MNTLLPSLLCFLFLIGLHGTLAQNIACYECIQCRDEIEYFPVKRSCRVCGKTTRFVNNEVVDVTRRCLSSCSPSDQVISGIGQMQECCYSDLCNGAGVLKASIFVSIFAYLIAHFSC